VSAESSLAPGGLVELPPGSSLNVVRGSPVVVIPVYGQTELFERCLRSVVRHTPADVPVLVADDATPDQSPADVVRQIADEESSRIVYLLRQPRNLGFPLNVNTAFEASAPADVVILNSDCEVGPEWLERLRAAAYSDSLIATATALTNNGTILTVPPKHRPDERLPPGHDIDSAARAVASRSLLIRPRIPTAIGHCAYIRRSALELVGGFDPIFSSGYGEEVDFSQRCSLRGLVHVAADDVYVYHVGRASLHSKRQESNEKILEARYPEYHHSVNALVQSRTGPLVRALSLADVALTGLSVTIDARCLGPVVTGTQVLVLELIRGLARADGVRVRALVSPSAAAETLAELSRLGVEKIRSDDVPGHIEPSAIVHRPYQVGHVGDLALLDRLGRRLVITQLDLIAYRTPGYAGSPTEKIAFQRLTRSVLSVADFVLFISQHALDDALADELVDPTRSRAIYLGMDDPSQRRETRPPGLSLEAEQAYLLYVGTDFRHKNRLFALQILEQLELRHGWKGHLVFAGPHAASGTSSDDEADFLESRHGLRARVTSLGSVSESEKAWLYRHTAGVIYPTIYEGFGLVPLEAASYGRPCFFASQTALSETLPGCETLVPWDAAASADAIHEVLVDEEKASSLASAIGESGRSFKWSTTTERVLAVYDEVIGLRARDLRAASNGASAESIAAGANSVAIGDFPPIRRRALASLLARPRLRALVLVPLTFVFSVGYLVKHRHLPKAYDV
jgi:GT2 family glycosyltransferase